MRHRNIVLASSLGLGAALWAIFRPSATLQPLPDGRVGTRLIVSIRVPWQRGRGETSGDSDEHTTIEHDTMALIPMSISHLAAILLETMARNDDQIPLALAEAPSRWGIYRIGAAHALDVVIEGHDCTETETCPICEALRQSGTITSDQATRVGMVQANTLIESLYKTLMTYAIATSGAPVETSTHGPIEELMTKWRARMAKLGASVVTDHE